MRVVQSIWSSLGGKTFAALRHRNYRLWFWGQMISIFGYWMQSSAQAFLVYDLTRSPLYLGYLGFCGGLPAWLFMLYGGAVADRASRRTLLLLTQSSMMLLAFILAALTWAGAVQPWHVLVLTFLTGTANAFDTPARHAFVAEMVTPADLTNAIALNSVLFNVGTVLGPAAGGLIYESSGPAWCFFLNGATFVAVLIALWAMQVQVRPARPRRAARDEVAEALQYVRAHPKIRRLLAVAAVTSLFGVGLFALMPAWAAEVLHGDARTNGFLQTARGIGALVGALALASLNDRQRRPALLSGGMAIFSVLLFLFSFVHAVPLALGLLSAAGIALLFSFTLTNSFVQLEVHGELRGRVMSIYLLTFFGFVPLGALFVGYTAEYCGAPFAVRLNAALLFAAAILIHGRLGRERFEAAPPGASAP